MKEILINNQITASEIRVLSDRDEHLGTMSLENALAMAKSEEKDLILIAPNAQPPLCKIQEIGKYKYDLMKKERHNKKNQKTVELKEIRITCNINDHDLQTKQKQAVKFLSNGDKVKLSMRFRGREIAFLDNGKEIIQGFTDTLDTDIKFDKPLTKEGNTLVAIITKK